jgi:ring-1,2-phenylacetyl-CoA epoxidase subunit PaaA
VSRDQLIADLHAGKVKYSSIFNYPTLTWADIGAIGWLVDGAAIMNQIPLCRCSYGPYARAMVRICKEESFHQRQGSTSCTRLPRHAGAEGDGAGRAQPLVVAVAHDVRAARRRVVHSAQSRNGRSSSVQRRAAPALRRPDRAAGGLSRHHDARPGSQVERERGHYDFGPIDWSEFHSVLKGNGPCNRERLAARVEAWDNGAWVREAAVAHAKKQSARKEAA